MLLFLFIYLPFLLLAGFCIAPWGILLLLEILKKRMRLNKIVKQVMPYQITLMKMENALLKERSQMNFATLKKLEEATLVITQHISVMKHEIYQKGLNEDVLEEQFQAISDLIGNIHRLLDVHLGTASSTRSISLQESASNG